MRQKILVIKLGALGDFIFASGAMQGIREAFPEAEITLLTGPAYIGLAKMSEYFDAIETDARTKNPKDWWRICKKILADNKWDYVLDLQISNRTKKKYYTLARLLTKYPMKWGLWDNDGFKLKESPEKIPFTWGKTTTSFLNVKFKPASLSFCYDKSECVKKLPKKYVLLIPGCSAANSYKRWPAEFYGQVAKALADKGIPCVVIGTNAEKKEIDIVCSASPMAINFCNQNKIVDIPDIAHHALAVIGNDTGPMHMAELTDVPAISLFCEKTKQACQKRANVTNFVGKKIDDISPEEVIQKLFSVL